VRGYACFLCIYLKTAIWLFLGQGLAFFDEDRSATLPSSLLDCYSMRPSRSLVFLQL